MSQDSAATPGPDLADLNATFGFKGTVLTPSDAGFDAAAFGEVCNELRPSRHPQVIAQVADEQDVAAAVKFARAKGLQVTVRGGGHNWCSPSLRGSGLLIDLSNLTGEVSIDADAGKAVVRPIISNREAQAALNPLGWSYPTGHCPTVKASGYLLSGGMAWNHGVWGPGVGSIEAIEIVTANGDMITASADENPDFFWAARGGGPGFFGVATRFHLKLYPLPKAITGSAYYYPYDTIVDVAEWLGSLASDLPSSVELSLWAVEAPPDLAARATSSNGRVALVTATMFADSRDEAEATLAALETCPVIDQCLSKSVAQPATFDEIFDASGALWPAGLRSKVDALFYNTPLAEIMAATKDHIQAAPSPKTVFMFAVFTGAQGAPATPPDAAFSMTGKLYGGSWTMWDDLADDAVNAAWHDDTMRLLEPFIVGHYISETDTVSHPEYAERSYAPEAWQRLAELRETYDPDGLFFGFTGGFAERARGQGQGGATWGSSFLASGSGDARRRR